MVQQAIQNGGRLAAQHGALVADGSVRRDHDASSFVAAADELELQTRGGRRLEPEFGNTISTAGDAQNTKLTPTTSFMTGFKSGYARSQEVVNMNKTNRDFAICDKDARDSGIIHLCQGLSSQHIG